MKNTFTVWTIFVAILSLPVTLFAESDEYPKVRVDSNSASFTDMVTENTYGKGGPREGKFFADLRESAPVQRKKIADFYQGLQAFEIAERDMDDAIEFAKQERNFGIATELQQLQNAWNVSTDGKRGMIGKQYKEIFIQILQKQFDQRVEILVGNLEKRLAHHNGNYNSMLEEYGLELEKIEKENRIAGVKKFFIITGIAAGMFFSSFFGIPLIGLL